MKKIEYFKLIIQIIIIYILFLFESLQANPLLWNKPERAIFAILIGLLIFAIFARQAKVKDMKDILNL